MNRDTQRYTDSMEVIRTGRHNSALYKYLHRELGLNTTTKAREATGSLSEDEIHALTVLRAIMEGRTDG